MKINIRGDFMSNKNVTFTMKIDKNIRDVLKEFCKSKGFLMKSFIERAIIDQIEKEELKEDLLAIEYYEKYEKNNTIPLEKVAEELGMYSKKKKNV
jgi:molybdopterin-guanine dinucleotide biosynthesis protein A